MTIGMLIAAVAFSAWAGPLWPFVLVGSLIVIGLLGPFAVAPAYLFLKRRSLLRPWWALFVGVVAINLPNILFVVLHTGPSYESLNGEVLVDFDGITAAGVYHKLIKPALVLSPFGALGAAVAWLLAFGFRWKPPHDTGEATAGTSE
jgi:hypothetical protein